jgi:pentatricopeptide repeat protein
MISDAVLVLDRMPGQDTISWNSVISGCSSNGLNSEAIELFIRMWTQGQELDSVTLLSVLPACAQSLYWFAGRVVHGYLVKTGLIGETSLANALLDMYSNCSDWQSTNYIIRSMGQKNVVSWTSMIMSYMSARLFDKVAGLLQEMVLDAIRPDVFTVTSALHAFAGDESLKQGKSAHGYTIRNGMEKLLPIANALMEMYVKCRNVEEAWLIFDRVTNKDVISWNTLRGGYSRNNFPNESLSLFSDMLLQFKPNAVMMTCILPATTSISSLERGREIHAYAVTMTCILPAAASIWVSLLHRCRIHKNVKLAEKVADKVFKLEPENTGYYVLLANIYAEAERWEAVKKLKNKIGGRGLRENTNYSWIEVRGKVHVFIADNRNHPD